MEQLRLRSIAVLITLVWFSSPAYSQYCGFQYADSSLLKIPSYVAISGGVISNMFMGSEIDFRESHGSVLRPAKGAIFSIAMKNEISPYVYVKWGLEYLERRESEEKSGFADPYNITLTYIAAPLKVGFQPVNFGNLNKKLQAGIEAGVAVNFEKGFESDRFKRGLQPGTTAINVKQTLYSASLGANFEYRIFPRRVIFFNYTYYRDFTTLFTRAYMGKSYDLTASGWNLTGGLMFLLRQPGMK
jgi:hypothetical protein